jgi:hypothetical protein
MRRSNVALALAVFVYVSAVARAASPAPDDLDRYNRLLAQPLQAFTNVDFADYLRLRAMVAVPSDPPQAVAHYALKAIGQAFRLGALRFDLSESDCVVLCERSLAAALASDWDSFYRLADRLRYRNGAASFLEANFFTLEDFVPNNAWLLADVSGDLGPVTTFSHVVWPKRFFEKLSFGEDDTATGRAKAAAKAAKIASLPERLVTPQAYIPRDQLPGAIARMATGDILLVIRRFVGREGQAPWLDCDHMMVAVKENGAVHAVHSCRFGVQRAPLSSFLRTYPAVMGLKVLRLRDDAARRVAEELARMGPVPVPTPAEVDALVQSPRAMRQ